MVDAMATPSRLALAVLALTLLLQGCSPASSDTRPFDFRFPPFDLRTGEAGCVFDAGDDYPWGINTFGPLRNDQSQERSEGRTETDRDFVINTRLDGGTLFISVYQPSDGEQTASYDLVDIPEEGVVLEGPWGGPYMRYLDGYSPDTYRMTCWTG